MMLLKSIASSQDHRDIEKKKIKQLMKISTQWPEENEQHEMTQEEITGIVKDVILEVEKIQKRPPPP
jgi:hypothetical protein